MTEICLYIWIYIPIGLASVGTKLLTWVRQGRYLRWEPFFHDDRTPIIQLLLAFFHLNYGLEDIHMSICIHQVQNGRGIFFLKTLLTFNLVFDIISSSFKDDIVFWQLNLMNFLAICKSKHSTWGGCMWIWHLTFGVIYEHGADVPRVKITGITYK